MKYSTHTLGQAQRIENYLSANLNLSAIYIRVPHSRIQKLFGGNPAQFFRILKNGLHSIGGLSNRKFFEGLSGAYFYMTTHESMEMVILYKGAYPENQTRHRIKKILGIDVELEFGSVESFKSKIMDILDIKTQSQFFGDAFFEKTPV
jgi:hypothetical protein